MLENMYDFPGDCTRSPSTLISDKIAYLKNQKVQYVGNEILQFGRKQELPTRDLWELKRAKRVGLCFYVVMELTCVKNLFLFDWETI